MSAANNGGPAFPREDYQTDYAAGQRGMDLRDYFAAKAMQGICSHGDTWGLSTDARIAGVAYSIADAMLAERAKE